MRDDDTLKTHPQILPIDPSLSSEIIAEKLGEPHAWLYELIQRRLQDSLESPAIFERQFLSLPLDEHGTTLHIEGIKYIHEGWFKNVFSVRDYPEDFFKRQHLPSLFSTFDEAVFATILTHPEQVYLKNVHVIPSSGSVSRDISDVLQQMCDYGIGRPSTYASTITRLLDDTKAPYVIHEDQRLRLAPLGKQVLHALQEMKAPIADPKFSAQFEADLDKLEAGEINTTEILQKNLAFLFKNTILEAPWLEEITRLPLPLDPALHVSNETMGDFISHAKEPIPALLDPEKTLPPNHPLRILRCQEDLRIGIEKPDDLLPPKYVSLRRMHRAKALMEHYGMTDVAYFIERVQYDLLFRWFIGFDVNSSVWSVDVFKEFILSLDRDKI